MSVLTKDLLIPVNVIKYSIKDLIKINLNLDIKQVILNITDQNHSTRSGQSLNLYMQVQKETPFGTRRAEYFKIDSSSSPSCFCENDIGLLENFDIIYRSLCAVMYNFAPLSGHPGGSISSGRIVTSLLYCTMKYDISNPDRHDADIISYSAGHKALGLYAHWALRNEIMRIASPEFLPSDIKQQLRLEDLLGFRRNPVTNTPLFKKFNSKALDGHPTPATPFVKLSTGASGVGFASSVGLAFGAADMYENESGDVRCRFNDLTYGVARTVAEIVRRLRFVRIQGL